MRTLTVTRGKTFVACLGKLKLYIEDYTSPETTILDIPCRKLGTLKNGETQSFEITEEPVRVFAIFDKVSKGFCNEYFPIPAGNLPVYLTGKCHFNPANGNAFRFDGVADETVLANRKKGNSIGLIVLVAALVIGFAVGIFAGRGCTRALLADDPKTFSGSGYSITLTDEFEPESYAGYVAVYEEDHALVMISKETFASLPGLSSTTVTVYGQTLQEITKNQTTTLSCTDFRTVDGLSYFDYTANIDGDNITYRVFVSKGSDAFWILQIATPTPNLDDMERDMMAWAKSFKAE